MGKGDKRSRRGKIFAGSHGKTRPKPKKEAYVPSADGSTSSASAEEKVRKPKIRKKKADEEEAAA
jgi:30S ribosomal protein S31